jgi:CHASE2 domain-containing sensor protein
MNEKTKFKFLIGMTIAMSLYSLFCFLAILFYSPNTMITVLAGLIVGVATTNWYLMLALEQEKQMHLSGDHLIWKKS